MILAFWHSGMALRKGSFKVKSGSPYKRVEKYEIQEIRKGS